MNDTYCTNCNAKIDGVCCKNCFMMADPKHLAGTMFCQHLRADRTPDHDETGEWFCVDCYQTL